jgi:hypothetical protein
VRALASGPSWVTHRKRRWLGVLVFAAVIAALVTATVLWQRRDAARQDVQVAAALRRLDVPLPELSEDVAVVMSHPSCDNAPPCRSAARTWSSLPEHPSFAQVNDAVSAWARHNELTDTVGWSCGRVSGLFGGPVTPGCQWVFVSPERSRSVYVAVTLTDDRSWLPASGPDVTSVDNPVAQLGGRTVASLSVQIVGNSS